jgi:serpin B
MRVKSLLAFLLVLALVAVACSDDGTAGTSTLEGVTSTTDVVSTEGIGYIASDAERKAADAPQEDVAALAAGNRAFASDAYAWLAAEQDGNVVFSPVSVRMALAMTYAGARGETADEMAAVLHFDLDDDALHAAFNTLDQLLASRNRQEEPGSDGEERKVELSIANALWGQEGFGFEQQFLDLLAENYDAGMRIVDYVGATEQARRTINDWVAGETNDRITELIPGGVLSALTRLVITNAVYLDATWSSTFDANDTWDAPFTLLDGTEVTVPTMHQDAWFPYAAGDGWQAVELPYVGEELAMVILVPDTGRFAEVEGRIGDGLIDEVVAGLSPADVSLGLPKFEFRTKASMVDMLRELGMPLALDAGAADFSGMTVTDRLFISAVLHEAFISVDEAGTEAAAATAVVMDLAAAPLEGVELRVDRPFMFWLHDRETGTVLFMGRVLDPAA